jgi:hypothetical protein
MLYEYVNDFTPMWCVDSVLVGMNQGNARVLLPQGTVEVHNASLRVPAIYTGTDTVSLGGITRDFGVGVTNLVTTIGYLPPVGAPATLQFIVETSDDGVTFTNCYTGSLLTIVVGTWVWFNIVVPIPHRYYRVRDNTAQTVASSAVYTCGTP